MSENCALRSHPKIISPKGLIDRQRADILRVREEEEKLMGEYGRSTGSTNPGVTKMAEKKRNYRKRGPQNVLE